MTGDRKEGLLKRADEDQSAVMEAGKAAADNLLKSLSERRKMFRKVKLFPPLIRVISRKQFITSVNFLKQITIKMRYCR